MTDPIFPYQLEGAQWLAKQERAGLHDEAGMGKTRITIKALDLNGLTRGVVIARAMLRHEWLMEHEKWSETPRRLVKGRTYHDFLAWQRGHFDVLLLSYEMASKWAPHFAAAAEIMEFAVIDEAHFIRNPYASRTKHILGADCDGCGGIIQWAHHVYHLTGTPMNRSPLDIWAFLSFVRAIDLTRHEFETYFFEQGRVKEFQELYSRFALRRTLATVGYQMPDIHYTQMRIDGCTKEVDRYFKEHEGLDTRITAALEAGNLSFIDGAHLMTLRRLFAEAKAVPFAAYLVESLKNSEFDKVVVMGFHKSALETIYNKLRGAGLPGFLVNGDTPENDRVTARVKFQEDPKFRFFVGNSTTAGAGITLHAACNLFLFESEWNPGDNEQMIKRIRRIGQKRQQHARFVTLSKSYDETLIEIIIRKTKEIANAQGNLTTLPQVAFAA